jgi:antitoxin component YwqK of YwqJK toxin-antitoxin module
MSSYLSYTGHRVHNKKCYNRPVIVSTIPSFLDKLKDFLRLKDFDDGKPSQNGYHYTRYKKYIMKSEMTYVDGKIHGIYREWYLDGQIKIYCNYVYGEKHGNYKEWNPDGTLKFECNYENKQN